MGILWSLALAQLRHHRGRWALLAAGIALVVAVPITSAGLASQVRADSITRAISQLDPTARALFVSVEGSNPHATSPHTDEVVRSQLARLGDKPVRRQMAFRQLTVEGQSFFLAAADSLSTAVTITSGRLPRTCTPTHCEVVLLGKPNPKLTKAAASLGAYVVGTARRTDPRLISGQLDAGTMPLLVGNGAIAMSRLKTLELFSRFYSWTADIDTSRVVDIGVPTWLARSSDVDDKLDRAVVGNSVFTRPGDALLAADNRAQTSTRRFQLLGGLAAALLLGFAVVAACGLRRETALLVSALRRRGAVAGQIGAVVAGQAVLAVLGGAIVGGLLGSAAVAAVADGSTIGPALTDSRVAVVVLAAAAAIVVTAVLLWPDARARALWTVLDLVALFSLGAAVLAADRGTSDLSNGGDPLVITLPVLVAVISGLVAARLWAPLSQLVARLLPARSVAGRIGLLGLIRRPLRPAATVAFLTAAIASVVFAGAYRATLLAGAADQAAFQVPLDTTVTTGPDGTLPGDSVATRPGAYAVLRVSAAVTELPGVVESVPVLGVDAGALPVMNRWSRTTGSSTSAASLAAKLQPAAVAPGPEVPSGTTLTIPATGLDKRTDVTIWVSTPAAREVADRAHAGDGRADRAGAGGARAAARDRRRHQREQRLQRSRAARHRRGTHRPAEREGHADPRRDQRQRRSVATDWSSFTSQRGTTTASDGKLQLRYNVTGEPLIAVPGGPTTLPVAVDPSTAKLAHGGVLQVTLDGTSRISLQIVAVLPRMPTMGAHVLRRRSRRAGSRARSWPAGAQRARVLAHRLVRLVPAV